MKYLPHCVCLLGDHFLTVLHMFPDAAIAFTCLTIPIITLILMTRVSHSASFREFLVTRCASMRALPTLFLLASGGDHLLDMLAVLYPMCRVQAWWKFITAVTGLATIVILGAVAVHDDGNS